MIPQLKTSTEVIACWLCFNRANPGLIQGRQAPILGRAWLVSSEWIFRDDVTLRFSTGRQSYCIITLSRLSNKTAVILPMCIVYGYHPSMSIENPTENRKS
ncbi:hypothetical protein HZ326_15041 [Fusarium oxysporum f. sp. albedinis]|nr:hypothetical protein HZ326_15041 [Fusarium oxysporum f. sp. albedinis]